MALAASPWLASGCGEAPPTPRAALGRPPIAAADGQVMGVNQIPVNDFLAQNLSVTIRPDLGEPVEVQLAPGWYLEQNGLRFEPGDRIRAEGVMRTREGTLVARSVRKGNTTVLLRNAAGEPLWETQDAGPR
jgi:hypothetical protein